MHRSLFVLLFLPLAFTIGGTDVPFHRGVNLSTWLQDDNARSVQFTKYTKKDFQNIASLGADVVRLPINLHGMTGGAPLYTIDPLLYRFLDSAATWCEQIGLHLILDNHSFDPAVNTTAEVENILIPVWKQLAQHMSGRSSLIHYEVLNEPHGISDSLWGAIQGRAIAAIRTVDTKHSIIVGGSGWNSYNNLSAIPVYADTNLIYTFHFYDPFLFTHQGASWASPSLVPLANMPFPYDAARMPGVPAALTGTWVQSSYNNYKNDGTSLAVQTLLAKAIAFRAARKVPVFCGEFGVFIPNSPPADRVAWYQLVRTFLETNGIAWTSWDYQNGFGLFQANTAELFDHHLNTPLLSALGFTIPPQVPFSILPDSTAVTLYDDFIGPRVTPWHSGTVDYYDNSAAPNGAYSIRWKDAPQYGTISFDFVPDKDLSRLKKEGYAFRFLAKSTSTSLQFDVRFVDTKTGPTDHPWRMRTTISGAQAGGTVTWKEVRIPLSSFTEHGSWDSTWYNPAGLFDWKAVDRFEIVAEQSALTGKELWFDDIAIVPASSNSVAAPVLTPTAYALHQNFPNPFNPQTTIRFDLPERSSVRLRVYNIVGQLIAEPVNAVMEAGTHQAVWNAAGASGIYFCRMDAGSFSRTIRMAVVH